VATTALAARGIRHLPGQAGFFVMVDLSAHLDEPTFTAEKDLWRRMVAAGVNLTPGADCRSSVPGVFRMCFAATPVESLAVGVDRIASAIR
jgi:1-aminocyclopropane-1-carboxylate synthase